MWILYSSARENKKSKQTQFFSRRLLISDALFPQRSQELNLVENITHSHKSKNHSDAYLAVFQC